MMALDKECCSAKCHLCKVSFNQSVTDTHFMLNVIMPNVVMQNVVAPGNLTFTMNIEGLNPNDGTKCMKSGKKSQNI